MTSFLNFRSMHTAQISCGTHRFTSACHWRCEEWPRPVSSVKVLCNGPFVHTLTGGCGTLFKMKPCGCKEQIAKDATFLKRHIPKGTSFQKKDCSDGLEWR